MSKCGLCIVYLFGLTKDVINVRGLIVRVLKKISLFVESVKRVMNCSISLSRICVLCTFSSGLPREYLGFGASF